jgi:hypothetical protein
MLWGAAQQNVANHWSAQQRWAQRKQNYEELEEGGDNRQCQVPKQPAAANLLLPPNMERPLIMNGNPLDIAPHVAMLIMMGPADKEVNRVSNNNDLISLGNEFEPQESMEVDGLSILPGPVASSSISTTASSITQNESSSINSNTASSLATTAINSTPALM